MGNVMHRVFMGLIVFVLVLGVGMVVLGNIQQNHYAYLSSRQEMERDALLKKISETYTNSGVSDALRDAVEQYLQQIPEETRINNNFILLDEDGEILYRYSDQYLRAGSTKISIFLEQWYGAIVYAPDQFDVFGVYSEGNYEDSGYFGDRAMTVEAAEKTRQALRVWSVDGNNTRKRMTLVSGTQQNKNFLLLWLYNDDVIGNLYAATNQNYPWGLWNGILNAGAILILAYWLLLPMWVFLDARRKKIQPLPWALLVLVTNIVGMIVYWIVQNQTGKTPAMAGPVCPACGKPVQEEHPYCPWCATPLHRSCAACGKLLERGWVACPWCGKSSGE